MPELPDITLYIEALERRVVGRRLDTIRIRSPFLVRTYDPHLASLDGKVVRRMRRLGKRIVFGFDDELWLILHLMISGRLHWKDRGAKFPGKGGLAAFGFEHGRLLLSAASITHAAT